MLGTPSGVGKLLKDKFPDIILLYCLSHRLELAVGNALEITSFLVNAWYLLLRTVISFYLHYTNTFVLS